MKMCLLTIFMTKHWPRVFPRPRVCGAFLQMTLLFRGFLVGASEMHLGHLVLNTSQSDYFH